MAHSSLAMDTREIALGLYELLRDLDPARWRDDLDASIRARLADIARALSALVDRTWPDDQLDRLRARLAEVRDILARYTPGEDATRDAWMDLRARCQPAYEALAKALEDAGTHVPSLRPTNYFRNAYHVANGLGVILAVQLVLTTRPLMIGVAVAGFLAAWSMELGRRVDPRVNNLLMGLFGKVAHPHEAFRINSATWYTTAILILALFFTPEVGVAALAVLTFGDPFAAIVGRRFGRTELVNGRTLEGSVAFVAVGAVAAGVALALFYPAPLWLVVVRALAAAVAGAAAELLTRRVDDNLAIPVAAAVVGALVRLMGA